MRRPTDFAAVVRSGMRARRGSIVLHQASVSEAGPPIVGLIVGKTVGGSVHRHQVSRRLRAQLFARLDELPPGTGTVVRALPGAAGATSAELAADLDAAFGRLGRPQ
jgi:ribonuclease P protein component